MTENKHTDTRRTHWEGCWQIHPYCEIDKMRKTISELENKILLLYKWTKVSDKLPKDNVRVLVVIKEIEKTTIKICSHNSQEKQWSSDSNTHYDGWGGKYEDIISWMSLPEFLEVK